jgi:hypothetical protein
LVGDLIDGLLFEIRQDLVSPAETLLSGAVGLAVGQIIGDVRPRGIAAGGEFTAGLFVVQDG